MPTGILSRAKRGDVEQLQPIEAGAAFRAIAERVGYQELSGIRRQREAWQREASSDFARGQPGRAFEPTRSMARFTLARTGAGQRRS